MIKSCKIIFAICLVLTVSCCWTGIVRAETTGDNKDATVGDKIPEPKEGTNYVIARINEDIITYKDVEEIFKRRSRNVIMAMRPSPEREKALLSMWESILEGLIYQKLILQEARKYQVDLPDETVQKYMDQVIANEYGDRQNAEKELERSGRTLQDLFTECRNRLLVNSLRHHDIKSQLYVSPKEVVEYYEHNKEKFRIEEKRRVQRIVIPYGEDKDEYQALKKAEEFIAKVKESGGNFEKFVPEYDESSEKGNKEGWFLQGDFIGRKSGLNAEVEKVLFSMKENEISGPIKVKVVLSNREERNLIWVIKARDIQPEKVTPIEDENLQKDIMSQLQQAKEEFASKKYILDLTKKAIIKVYNPDQTEIKDWLKNRQKVGD